MSDAGPQSELLQKGLEFHQTGRLDEARECYRQVLSANPNAADAWHLMGLLLHQQGHSDQGVTAIERAISLNGQNPAFLSNLGGVLMSLGRHSEAEAVLRRGQQLAPHDVSVLNNLGVVLLELEQPGAAVPLFEQVLAASPQHARAHMNLGNAHRRLGRMTQAVECYETARTLAPDDVDVLANLGGAQADMDQLDDAQVTLEQALQRNPGCVEAVCNLAGLLVRCGERDRAISVCQQALASDNNLARVHERLGQLLLSTAEPGQAEQHLRTALQLAPRLVDARFRLGLLLKGAERLDEAISVFQQLVEQRPEHSDGWNQLGLSLTALGQLDQAAECYRRALEHDSESVAALTNLGDVLSLLGQLQSGVDCFRKALEIRPDSADTLNNLGCTLMMMGRADEALISNRKAFEISGNPSHHSVSLLCEQYQPDVTAASLLQTHRVWHQRHADNAAPPHSGRTDRALPERMKIGFVSPDFGCHPVGFFLLPCLQHMDHDAFEIVCYSDRRIEDSMTERIRSNADQWHRVRALSDDELATRIHADGIDILFDLAGHTAHNRLRTFARKPAPVQASWAGYVGTTGLSAMDFVIADRFHIPQGEDDCYTESVYRMPNGYVCFIPPEDAPDVGPLPAVQNGHITFGYLGNPCKVTASVIETWSRLLKEVPDAQLLWKFIGMDDPDVRSHFERQFHDHGVDSGRIMFEGRSPHREFLAAWNRVDIGLDTFPYSSGLTVCESLLMGVPMVTMAGGTFAGRHATGHQSNLGLTDVIATSLTGYIDIATRLAGDIPMLAELRSTLRQRLLASPLCDYESFADCFSQACRHMWSS